MNELKMLRNVLVALAAGLAVVIALVIRREVIRDQALKNTNKNTIDVAISKEDTKSEDGTLVNSMEKEKASKQQPVGDQKKDLAMIREFYGHVLSITPGDWNVKKYLSSELAKKIWETEYEGTYSIWEFRTGLQDGPENASKIISISAMQDGWYEVVYSDMGTRGITLVHMANGVIDDYKRIEPKPEFV